MTTAPEPNEKTTTAHWDQVYGTQPRMRLPSSLNIGTLNLKRLLRRYARPGHRFLEIGCAPGKMLAWAQHDLGVRASGLDYSEPGVEFTNRLLSTLHIPADVRCENVFATSFAPGSFDVVFSAGVIEHFDDPRELVAKHVELLAPGGVAVITVPNYGGVMGTLQARLDPANLAIHNTGIMNEAALKQTAPATGVSARVFRWGRFSPWILNLSPTLPARIAQLLSIAGNAAGLLQPFDIAALAPLFVLEIRKPR
jgi:2-polyprenyl-3-methyl-5-hydroxy-6-metoxy-1,4-benzoquinol methylase